MQTGSFVVSIWNEEEEDYDDVWLLGKLLAVLGQLKMELIEGCEEIGI